jgi:hypothetical protein
MLVALGYDPALVVLAASAAGLVLGAAAEWGRERKAKAGPHSFIVLLLSKLG